MTFDKWLLMLHASIAVGLLGAVTHNGLIAISSLRGYPVKQALRRTYSSVMTVLYTLNFCLGLFIYPSYRVRVRAGFMDEQMPLGTGLFEIKEHLLGYGFALLVCHFLLSRAIDSRENTPDARLFHVAGIAIMVFVIFSALTGFGQVSVRSI